MKIRYQPGDLLKAIELTLDGLWQCKQLRGTRHEARIRKALGYCRRLEALFRKTQSYSLETCFDPREPPTNRVRRGKTRDIQKANWTRYKRERDLKKYQRKL